MVECEVWLGWPIDRSMTGRQSRQAIRCWAVGLLGCWATRASACLIDRTFGQSVVGSLEQSTGCEAAAGCADRFLFSLLSSGAPGCPINFRGGGLKVRSIGCCLRCRYTSIIVWQHPKPAAAVFSGLFEGDEFHLLPGVSDLSLGEPALCTPLDDQGCRCRPGCQNIFQEYFWIFPPARLSGRHFGWRPSRTQPLKYVPGHHRPLLACS
jgi:hypothetical protein